MDSSTRYIYMIDGIRYTGILEKRNPRFFRCLIFMFYGYFIGCIFDFVSGRLGLKTGLLLLPLPLTSLSCLWSSAVCYSKLNKSLRELSDVVWEVDANPELPSSSSHKCSSGTQLDCKDDQSRR